jgi:hypothetical protein
MKTAIQLYRVPGKAYDTGKHQWSFGAAIRFEALLRTIGKWLPHP